MLEPYQPPLRLQPSFPEFLWLWNRTLSYGTPAIHRRMAAWLEARLAARDHELLLLAFRDSGKSTVIGVFCAWLLLRQPDRRILVVGADYALARTMTRNVQRIVERHPLCRQLHPLRGGGEWAADRFTVARPGVLRDPSMLARGLGANLTGSRADVVICDDVEVPRTCNTQAKRLHLRERLDELAYILVPGGIQLYIGTPHSRDTIYHTHTTADAPAYLEGFCRLSIPIRNEQGQSSWPERFTAAKIDQLAKRSGPAKFASQMMLEATDAADGRLAHHKLRRYDDALTLVEANGEAVRMIGDTRMVAASAWWDPAFGRPHVSGSNGGSNRGGSGDGAVLAIVFLDGVGGYWLHRVVSMTHDPALLAEVDAATQLCRQVAAEAAAHGLPSLTVETNGIGRFLPGLLRNALREAGVTTAVVEHTSRTPKASRIVDAFDAILAAEALRAHRSVFASSFLRELREWRPVAGRCRHDDALDAVAGCLLQAPVRLPRRPFRRDPHFRADWTAGVTPIMRGLS